MSDKQNTTPTEDDETFLAVLAFLIAAPIVTLVSVQLFRVLVEHHPIDDLSVALDMGIRAVICTTGLPGFLIGGAIAHLTTGAPAGSDAWWAHVSEFGGIGAVISVAVFAILVARELPALSRSLALSSAREAEARNDAAWNAHEQRAKAIRDLMLADDAYQNASPAAIAISLTAERAWQQLQQEADGLSVQQARIEDALAKGRHAS